MRWAWVPALKEGASLRTPLSTAGQCRSALGPKGQQVVPFKPHLLQLVVNHGIKQDTLRV